VTSSSIRTTPTIRRYSAVPWARLYREIVWRQGEHVLTVGGTGSGKTTLTGRFLTQRSHVVVCVSKGRDPAFSHPPYSSFPIIRSWPPPNNGKDRVLLWPPNGKDVLETRKIKSTTFARAFDSILLHEGGWCIDIDELHYMADSLRLDPFLVDLEEQGRSAGISVWGNTQRPAHVPLAVYTNAAHAFLFLTQEEYDVRRLGSICNKHTTPKELMANLTILGPHEFVYIDRSGRIPPVRSKVAL
jgi:DNA helicase HerA-like ATPase